MKYIVSAADNQSTERSISINDSGTVIDSDAGTLTLRKLEGHQNLYEVCVGSEKFEALVRADSRGNVELSTGGYKYSFKLSEERKQRYIKAINESTALKSSEQKILAPMPGLIKQIFVQEQQQVRKGEALFVLEAMKMENVIKAPAGGVVRKLSIDAGSAVEKGTILCLIG